MKQCQQRDIIVDFIDLDLETEFQPIGVESDNQTKILEYQLRMKRAEYIAFFHPVSLFHLPGLLKLFIDQVFTSGFAYKRYRGETTGLLGKKPVNVVAVSDFFGWQVNLFDNSGLKTFWNRTFARTFDASVSYQLIGSAREKNHNKKEETLRIAKKMAEKLNPNHSIDQIEMF